ncbi:MAG: TIR domain-containing protein [Candidatus Auribacterota bacterium]|nr:TIR domain-containing protein [Candidatus Auribacterota bacterium]
MSGLTYSMINHTLYRPSKRKVFVSYHHKNDQAYADWLRRSLAAQLDVFVDRSLRVPIDSNDSEYINRVIREDQIVGSSITVVLCGPETFKRKYVDWEIRSTLHHEHALLGLVLPTASQNIYKQFIVPDRLHRNIQTGFAHWGHWNHVAWSQNPQLFINMIETAIAKSCNKILIDNSMEKMARNAG